jgi:hypothetical protein
LLGPKRPEAELVSLLGASKLTDFRDSEGDSVGPNRERRTFIFLLILSFFKLPVPPLEVLAKAPGLRMLSSAENELLKLLVDMLLLRLRP